MKALLSTVLTLTAAALGVPALVSGAATAQPEGAVANVVTSGPTRPLAVLSGGSLVLVGPKGYVTTIAPVTVTGAKAANMVLQFQWSSNGDYLGWEQYSRTSDASAAGWYDLVTHRKVTWALPSYQGAGWSVTSAGIQVFVPGEDITSPSTLVSLNVGGGKKTVSVKVPLSDSAAGYSGGFIVGPDITTGDQLWRVTSAGVVSKLQALPKPTKQGPPYEVTAASADGKVFAAELGDHTDGCGVGPPSRLYVVDEATGTVKAVTLPAGPNWRVWSFVFAPDDTLDATLINCTQRTTMQTTVFAISVPGVVTAHRAGAVVSTAAGNDVAYQLGEAKLMGTEGGPYVTTQALDALNLDGQPVPRLTSAATAIWAPGEAPPAAPGPSAATTTRGAPHMTAASVGYQCLPYTDDPEAVNPGVKAGTSVTVKVALGAYTASYTATMAKSYGFLAYGYPGTLKMKEGAHLWSVPRPANPTEYNQFGALCLIDLGPGQAPDVLAEGYSGGAHCCFAPTIYTPNATGSAYVTAVDFTKSGADKGVHWDPNAGFWAYKTMGKVLLRTDDGAFAYEFGCYACTPAPTRLFTVKGHALADVTLLYLNVVRPEQASAWKSVQSYLKSANGRETMLEGAFAQWAADSCELGQGHAMWKTVEAMYKAGDFKNAMQTFTGPFPSRLRAFLLANSYCKGQLAS